MPPQRETATDRLADVIEVAQLGQKTGLLTVERGNGITLEEGSITFVDGQVTEASAGGVRLHPQVGSCGCRRLPRMGK